MKKGFTLIEMLAVIVILSILAVIIVPTVQRGLDSNYDDVLEIQKKNIIKAAKDWSLEHLDSLPINNGDTTTISLRELKKGYLNLNVKNPETNKIWVDSSYVIVKKENNDYIYEVTDDTLYELDECEISPGFPLLFTEKCVSVSTTKVALITYSEIGAEVREFYNPLKQLPMEDCFNQQFVLNNNEISGFVLGQENIYTVVYTVIKNKGKTDEKCLKTMQTVTISNQCGNEE